MIIDTEYEAKLIAAVRRLSAEKRQRVLEIAEHIDQDDDRAMFTVDDVPRELPPGITGEEAIRIARSVHMDAESLDEMRDAIDAAFSEPDEIPEVDFDE